jgi:hypothetical protein
MEDERMGLFFSLVAFGARISFDVIWIPMYSMFVEAGVATYDIIWDVITVCILVFAVVSIVYLWLNRRSFFLSK